MFEIFQVATVTANAGLTINTSIGDVGNSIDNWPSQESQATTNVSSPTQLSGQASSSNIEKLVGYGLVIILIYGFIFKKFLN